MVVNDFFNFNLTSSATPSIENATGQYYLTASMFVLSNPLFVDAHVRL